MRRTPKEYSSTILFPGAYAFLLCHIGYRGLQFYEQQQALDILAVARGRDLMPVTDDQLAGNVQYERARHPTQAIVRQRG
jgi:hypothetical protein